ncbi:hypothetical protein [Ideonella sp.]|uniref:hypothetical protein n=1 Tax=Ideonella sp. TaxID=1929293 RepID=UPI0039C86BD0
MLPLREVAPRQLMQINPRMAMRIHPGAIDLEIRMKLIYAVTAASLILGGCATGPNRGNHAAHHSPAAQAPSPAPSASAQSSQMDGQMRAMREMHEKMMNAKTPEARAALMKDHMKAMQDGMAMMGRMKDGMGGDMRMSPQMMGKRMDMMEMMMQMMMDRDAGRPSAGN